MDRILLLKIYYFCTESSYSAMESNPGLLDLLDAFESNDAQYESDNLRPVPLVPNCAASPGISLQVNGDCETVSIVDPCLNDHNYIMKPRKLFWCFKIFIVSIFFSQKIRY